ncbi:hypothetical protein [Mycolicibacterium sp.]|nr:hypothetical protein [Mycolicibacterium sp.]MBJ7336904.1 hypothetical protein [Mycolicibacterium sp.]
MTAVIVIVVALLLGIGLVVSQLARLKEWLAKAPPPEPPEVDPRQE